jgi:hypothetical protein
MGYSNAINVTDSQQANVLAAELAAMKPLTWLSGQNTGSARDLKLPWLHASLRRFVGGLDPPTSRQRTRRLFQCQIGCLMSNHGRMIVARRDPSTSYSFVRADRTAAPKHRPVAIAAQSKPQALPSNI